MTGRLERTTHLPDSRRSIARPQRRQMLTNAPALFSKAWLPDRLWKPRKQSRLTNLSRMSARPLPYLPQEDNHIGEGVEPDTGQCPGYRRHALAGANYIRRRAMQKWTE